MLPQGTPWMQWRRPDALLECGSFPISCLPLLLCPETLSTPLGPQWCLPTPVTLQSTAPSCACLPCLQAHRQGSLCLYLNQGPFSSSDLPLWNSIYSPERTYGVSMAWTGWSEGSQIWGLRSPMKMGSPRAARARAQLDNAGSHLGFRVLFGSVPMLKVAWPPTSLLSNVQHPALPPAPPPSTALLGQPIPAGGREGQYGTTRPFTALS